MRVDLSKDGKENVLVMTVAFSKFSVAVVTPNQQVKIVAKALIDKWYLQYPIQNTVTRIMFGHKAQTPYDNWLGLSQYNCSESVSKHSWV